MILRVIDITRHRNGIAGCAFAVVRFVTNKTEGWESNGIPENETLTAVVFPEPGHVAVMTPGNPDQRWRGDQFEMELREALGQTWQCQKCRDYASGPSDHGHVKVPVDLRGGR